MATTNVPIEIVLQDPNEPIVPTPDPANPGESGENTNIAVPNTATGEGHTTVDGSGNNTGNIFTGPTATVSIVSVVILALALSGIITLLIHKYYKNRKAKDNKAQTKVEATKKEHLAMAATSTMAVLAASVLVGNLLMTTTNAATSSEGTELSTPDKIQIIANRYDDVTIVASTKAVSYATTDTSFGYKIFMSMAGDTGNLYLNGDTSEEHYFTPTTRAGLSNNSWGYSLDDGVEQAMTLSDNAIMAQQNTSAVSNDEFDVYYSMKADKDMPFGVYSGEIAYDIEGYNGFPASLTTMQGMTSEICDATYTPDAFKVDGVTIEDNVPTATLTDIRDNKTYTIAKLADGKCWMTQNLDLQKEDLVAGVTLDSTNTDNPASGFILPDSDSHESENDDWGSDETAINTAHVYDPDADTYYICAEYQPWGDCKTYSEEAISTEYFGNYYNWYSATAGTGTYDLGDGEVASGSICPTGWRLPNGASNDGANDYSTLMYGYGITTSPTRSSFSSNGAKVPSIFDVPFLFMRNGIHNNRGVQYLLQTGGIWLSMAAGTGNARALEFTGSSFNPFPSYYGKNLGFSVRCVAR